MPARRNNGLEKHSQAVAGVLLGLDWGLRAQIRMPEPWRRTLRWVLPGAWDARPQASVTSRNVLLEQSNFIGWINLLSRVIPT